MRKKEVQAGSGVFPDSGACIVCSSAPAVLAETEASSETIQQEIPKKRVP